MLIYVLFVRVAAADFFPEQKICAWHSFLTVWKFAVVVVFNTHTACLNLILLNVFDGEKRIRKVFFAFVLLLLLLLFANCVLSTLIHSGFHLHIHISISMHLRSVSKSIHEANKKAECVSVRSNANKRNMKLQQNELLWKFVIFPIFIIGFTFFTFFLPSLIDGLILFSFRAFFIVRMKRREALSKRQIKRQLKKFTHKMRWPKKTDDKIRFKLMNGSSIAVHRRLNGFRADILPATARHLIGLRLAHNMC